MADSLIPISVSSGGSNYIEIVKETTAIFSDGGGLSTTIWNDCASTFITAGGFTLYTNPVLRIRSIVVNVKNYGDTWTLSLGPASDVTSSSEIQWNAYVNATGVVYLIPNFIEELWIPLSILLTGSFTLNKVHSSPSSFIYSIYAVPVESFT
jgi:hypothetical protein